MGEDDARAGGRRARWLDVVTVVVVGLPVVALVALGVAFAVDGLTLNRAARALEQHAAAAQGAVDARDTEALGEEVAALESAAVDFTAATDGPHWWIATHLLWVRDQAVPLVTAGQAVGAIASDALAPLTAGDGLQGLEPPAPVDGRIDPLVLEPYRPALAQASRTLDDQAATLAATDLTGSVDQVREPFERLTAQVTELAGTVQAAHVTAELLPAMLGAQGPRTYVVLVQNNAEPRATGGVPGALIEVTADDGRLTRGRYVPSYQLTDRDGVAPLTEDEDRIFSYRMAVFPQDVNFTPHFPRAAELASAFWAARYGSAPDGVLALDPVALGWMLGDAPAVDVEGISVDGGNVAEVMLNRAYFEFPVPQQQDAFFAEASGALFAALVAGTGNALDGAERAIEARRFLLWSADSAEQELLETTPIAGAFLDRTDALGVFVNDGSASKIGYYVTTQARLTDHACTDGTVAAQTLTLDLEHTYDGEVDALPAYIGVGAGYLPAGEFHANVLFYPAAGTRLVSVTADGEEVFFHPDVHAGRPMGTVRIALAPQDALTLTVELEATDSTVEPPDYVQMPGPRPIDFAREDDAAAGCA